MAELTTAEHMVLDMLGDALKDGVVNARDRTGDDTIMARIAEGLTNVERGDPVEVVASGMSIAEAVEYLSGLE